MGPPKINRTISQEAFEGLVKENMEDLGMDPDEALQDAIETLTLQGVDLSGIVTCIPGVTSISDNPVIQCLDRLREIDLKIKYQKDDDDLSKTGYDEMRDVFVKFKDMCSAEGSGNATIAVKNGGLDLVVLICSKIQIRHEHCLVAALNALASLIYDPPCTEIFRKNGGVKIVMDILNNGCQNVNILNSGFSVVAAASTGNEVVKEEFMEAKIDEFLVKILSENSKYSIPSSYDAMRILLTPDDGRVVASQVYGYARKFAEVGIAGVLVDSLHEGFSSPNLLSACIALKAVAVNDEICRSIADSGGINATFQCIEDSGEQNNKAVAKACCSLMSKLAGSDANKSAIVHMGGMDKLIKLSSRFSDDPLVLQEIMSIICVLCLRSPENAARAIEAGVGDFAIQSMQKTILLANGIEKIIRKAKENHVSCKAAATDALRDLGLDNYNS
ncbi:hypothetical protein MKW94_003746 [Papaver nudicaule]|uniref:Armadillo repeat-containing protein 6 n=1 Tax=Papaver nudicaule TaxID=74823 RepID=A0AA41VNT1_PAPNU|nr:hypothetical protein [Papaver nudicaule]